MMQQWHSCKQAAPNAILLFRLGDFYEAFYEDAALLAKELGLALTKRHEIPMAGIPYHNRDTYVDKLIAKGYRVALAEQMEDPKQTKGLVRREIVRIVTPGTLVESSLLSDKSNNFFASLVRQGSLFGLAFLDISTGEFRVTEFSDERQLLNELCRLRAAELLYSRRFKEKHQGLLAELSNSASILSNVLEDWRFDQEVCKNFLLEHFKVHSLDGFGLKHLSAGISAAGALLTYLRDDVRQTIQHISTILPYNLAEYLILDRTTQRNLELTESQRDRSRSNTLLELLDRTSTPMGARLLQQWIKQPLLSFEKISERHDALEILYNEASTSSRITEYLGHVRDLERLIMKVQSGYAGPRDLVTLRYSLEPVPAIRQQIETLNAKLFRESLAGLEDVEEVTRLIAAALVDEPPLRLNDGGAFREGFHSELDELRTLGTNSRAWLNDYQERIRQSTGIKTLKVGFSRSFGYYIEVSKGQANQMPDLFIRRQTLVNAERFISPELKEFEDRILSAEEKIQELETRLFNELKGHISAYAAKVMKIAQAIAYIDTLNSLATVAREKQYVRPTIDESEKLEIHEGRHPVIEAVHRSETFIANDTFIDDMQRLMLITGPNMAGKSTYIRQVALIVILAQMGSFVPAQKAHIGIFDRVFTRIGASDDLSRGQSTFMVEMTETANILHNATDRSLVILDEIGRGTSTYDGISIAWAVAEYLLTQPNQRAKTLFATHYWELTKLEEKVPGAVNYHVAVRECDDEVIFLRKIVRGDADRSYGIHVARLAGLPVAVINRANEILHHLEEGGGRTPNFDPAQKMPKLIGTQVGDDETQIQLLLFEPAKPKKKSRSQEHELILELLKTIDVNHLTPMQAQGKLAELREILLTP